MVGEGGGDHGRESGRIQAEPQMQPGREAPGERGLVVGRMGARGGAAPWHQDQPAAGPQRIADQPHAGMTDGDLAGPQSCCELVRRQKPSMLQMPRHAPRVADLGKAGNIQLGGGTVGRLDQLVEAMDEGSDAVNNVPSAA